MTSGVSMLADAGGATSTACAATGCEIRARPITAASTPTLPAATAIGRR